MRRHAGYVDLPARKMDEKQHVVRHSPCGCPDLGGEEIGRNEDLHMRANELMPGRRFLSLRRWRNPMPSQDIPHGLVAYTIAQMRERSSDAIIAPRTILLGHAHHQCP